MLKLEPGIPEYEQEASGFQSNFSTCNFCTQPKKVWLLKVNKYNDFIATKITYHFNNSLCSAIIQLYHFSPTNIPYYVSLVSRKF